MSDYNIYLPTPHEKQADFITSDAKRKVIVAGRRGGKTTGAAMLAADAAMAGRRVLEAAPTAEQTGAFWDNVTNYFREPIANGTVYKHETKRLLKLPNDGIIRCKTAHNADTLRGDWGDLVILDEYQLMCQDAWDKVVAPMMLDTNGDTVFIGTPLRRNHFFVAYSRGVSENDRWKSWRFTSLDNPHLSQIALEEITQDMTDQSYRQEILAEFLDNQGAVFRNILENLFDDDIIPDAHNGHYVIGGVDWGKHSDFTAVSVGCVDCKQELAIDRFNKIDYAFQRGRLKSISDKWNVKMILAENNAMGEPIIEQLHREGLPHVRPFQTTAASKPPLIENLALSLEREEWKFISDPIWTAELQAYERKVSPTTGRSQYSAPDGMHDDTVIARALMVQAGSRLTASQMVDFS